MIIMTKDGSVRPMQATDLTEVADRDQRIAELLSACKMALSLLENIGTGKWAKTPAGDALRAVIEKETK